eukprot:323726_1
MSTLSNVQKADKRSKYIVFGYIREIESKLNLENIPMLISYLCFSYHYDPEYISKARDDLFEISNDKRTVTAKKEEFSMKHTIYCNQWIHSMSNAIVKWTFKINHLPKMAILFFGLASEQKDNGIYNDFGNSIKGKPPNYAIADDGDRLINGLIPVTIARVNQHVLYSNDEVTYTLDLQNTTFGCKINNNNELILFEYIKQSNDIKYKMVIQIAGKGGSVTLKNFTTTYK